MLEAGSNRPSHASIELSIFDITSFRARRRAGLERGTDFRPISSGRTYTRRALHVGYILFLQTEVRIHFSRSKLSTSVSGKLAFEATPSILEPSECGLNDFKTPTGI